MLFTRAVPLLFLAFGSGALAQSPPPPRDVTLSAADGTRLKGTYYAASIQSLTVLRGGLQSTRRTETLSSYRRFLTAGRVVKDP